jgi:lipopolysaccharide biosynthesis glycosyltransferase
MPTSKQFSKAVYWRLVLPNLLRKYGIERCLYLDVDTIAVGDFKELFSINLNGKACGAVLDINSDDHVERLGLKQKFAVNSGILLINVFEMAQYRWEEESYSLNESGRISFFDQDLVNVILDGDIMLLDIKFNVQSGHFQNSYNGDINIIHFTESNNTKPWNILCKHLYLGVYNTYMRKSGFYIDYFWFETIRRIRKFSLFT